MLADRLTTILERARDVTRDVILPNAATIDREARWPRENLGALQAAGLGGLVVPVEHGGLGQGLLAVARVGEIIGEACGSTGLCYGMHCVGTAVIAAKATPYQANQYLVPIAEGRHLTTLALSEPGSGSQFWIPETRLAPASPEAFQAEGTKAFVTNGGEADSYVVSTIAADPNAPPGTFSCILLDNGTKGAVWGPNWSGLGMRGNSSRTLELRGTLIPRQNLLGEEGDEIWYVFEVVAPYFLVAMSGTYLGVASAALNVAREHLSRRSFSHTGRRLAQNTIVQHHLGELWAEVTRVRQLVYYAAAQGDVGGADALPALLSAKAEAAESAVRVANAAMSLTGGIAYRDGSALDRHLRDARAAPVMSPTTDILRTWTGRALLDLPLLGE